MVDVDAGVDCDVVVADGDQKCWTLHLPNCSGCCNAESCVVHLRQHHLLDSEYNDNWAFWLLHPFGTWVDVGACVHAMSCDYLTLVHLS